MAIDRVAKGTYYFDHSAGADPAAKYEIRTVDGAGNASPHVSAAGPTVPPSRIIDDVPARGLSQVSSDETGTVPLGRASRGLSQFLSDKTGTVPLGKTSRGLSQVSSDGAPTEGWSGTVPLGSAAVLKYSGPWQRQTGLQPAYAGTLTTSNQPGATVSLTFDGKQVLWFSKLGPNAGMAAVSLDGGPAETIDTYAADDIWGVCVYRKTVPNAGPHELKIMVLGKHGPWAKGSVVAIDGFRTVP